MISGIETRKLVSMANTKKTSAAFFLLAVFFLSKNAAGAYASQADFYGIKMTSEHYAKGLVIDQSEDAPRFGVEKPGMDKRVFATGNLTNFLGARGIEIHVFNGSDQEISSHFDYAEYTVVTKDGERHLMKPPRMAFASTETIAPNKSATFGPVFEGGAIKKEDIRMVICSFDLGDIKIFLLPLTKKEIKPVLPAPAQAPVAATTKASANLRPVAPVKPSLKITPPPVRPAPPKKIKVSSSNNFSKDRIKEIQDKPRPATKASADLRPVALPPAGPPKKSEPIVSAAPEKKVERKKVPANNFNLSAQEKNMLDKLPDSHKTGQAPRVEKIHEDSGLIVVNMGTEDGLKKNSVLSIARDGLFVGKASVRELKKGYATASLLGNLEENVQVGDDVLFFDLAG